MIGGGVDAGEMGLQGLHELAKIISLAARAMLHPTSWRLTISAA